LLREQELAQARQQQQQHQQPPALTDSLVKKSTSLNQFPSSNALIGPRLNNATNPVPGGSMFGGSSNTTMGSSNIGSGLGLNSGGFSNNVSPRWPQPALPIVNGRC
jgi:hypothetical protein